MLKFRQLTKLEKKDLIKRSIQIILGTIILAFGQAVFIEQCNLVTGGLTSIGNIINNFLPSEYTVRITVVSLNVLLFLLGWIFIGKQFSAQTLLSTIVYTAIYPLFSMLIHNETLSILIISQEADSEATLLIASIFGGVLSGAGIAICMLGGGSTGGVDILSILIAKLTRTKISIWVFLIDACVVVLGGIFLNYNLIEFLICVLSTFCCSMTIDFIFVRNNNCFIVNIVSKNWEQINDYIIQELERGSTIFTVEGGYKFDNYRLVQAVVPRREYTQLLSKISEIDANAFVTINSAFDVNGEGFNTLPNKNKRGN